MALIVEFSSYFGHNGFVYEMPWMGAMLTPLWLVLSLAEWAMPKGGVEISTYMMALPLADIAMKHSGWHSILPRCLELFWCYMELCGFVYAEYRGYP